MKFLLLASGKIAENFLSQKNIQNILQNCLVGCVGTIEIISLLKKKKILSSKKFIEVGKKLDTEAQISEFVKFEKIDFAISIQYPWILSFEFLEQMSHRVINLHNGRLPDYRGHNLISHAILNGEKNFTTTLHWVNEEVDTGVIIATKTIKLRKKDTAYSLWERSMDSASKLLNGFLKSSLTNPPERKGRKVSKGGYFYSKNKIEELKRIPEKASFEKIDRISRAFWFPPKEPAYFIKGTKKLYVLPNKSQYKIE